MGFKEDSYDLHESSVKALDCVAHTNLCSWFVWFDFVLGGGFFGFFKENYFSIVWK